MENKPRQMQQSHSVDKPDQPYQFQNQNATVDQSQSPQANQPKEAHSVQEGADPQAQSIPSIPMHIYDIPQDNHRSHLYSDQRNIAKDDVDAHQIQSKEDQNNEGSPGSLHSIFFGQLLQSNQEPPSSKQDREDITQFQHQFANMDLNNKFGREKNGSNERDGMPREQVLQGHNTEQMKGGFEKDDTLSPVNMQYKQQMQMMMEHYQYKQIQSMHWPNKEPQQFMTPNKINMNSQMYLQQPIVSQNSEMTPNMGASHYFKQPLSNEFSYPTDDNDLRVSQQYNLLQTPQNQIYQKYQIDSLNPNHRKMSDNHQFSQANQNVYLDENVNKLVDLCEPSESNSTFNQTNFHAQINDMLNEDDDESHNVSHTVEPSLYQQSASSNINQQSDQFEDITVGASFENMSQLHKQIPQYNDHPLMYNGSIKNEPHSINQFAALQINNHNIQNNQMECMQEPTKIGGYINNQFQIDQNINQNSFENQRQTNQQVASMQSQHNMGTRNSQDIYDKNMMMQQHMNQRNQQQQMMMEDILMPSNQLINHQQISNMQQQIQATHMNESKLLMEQSQPNHMKHSMSRQPNPQYSHLQGQSQAKMQGYQQNSFQEHDSEFLQKVKQTNEQSKNLKMQMADHDQQYFDFAAAQAHEIINQNKQINSNINMPHHQQNQMQEAFQYDQSDQQPKFQHPVQKSFHNYIGPEQSKISNDMQRMVQSDDYQNLPKMIQQQLILNQKQSMHFNNLLAGNTQSLKNNTKDEYGDGTNHLNQAPGSYGHQQQQFIYQPATIDPNLTGMYQHGNSNQMQMNSQYLMHKQQQMINSQQMNQQDLYNQQSRSAQPNSIPYSANLEGSPNHQQINLQHSPYEYRPAVHPSSSHFEDNQMLKKKVPSRRQAHSEKEGYPQTQNFIDDEQIDNLNINHLSSTRKETRAQPTSQCNNNKIQVQTKGRTRRTGSSYVYRDKPIEIIPVDVQDIDIDIDNDINQDQSSQGTSKNKSKSYSSGGSKQNKDNSQMKYKKAKNKSSNNNDNDDNADKTNCSNSALIDTDSGQKPNFSNEQQSYSDSRGIGKGSRGGNSNSSKSGHHSLAGTNSHASNQSYDEFIQQIQHDVKKANKDPEKEFNVLNGHIIRLATKKVGSKFLQEHLGQANQSLINKIIDQIDGSLPDLMTDNYGNYFCSELIKYLQVHQRIHFMKQIKGNKFIEISCNNRGTYTLQNIIYAVTQPEEFEIIKETLLENNNICYLAKDKEGHHMLEKIITTFNEDQRQYIFNSIISKFNELATDKNGLCVLKKLIQHTKDQNSQRQVISKILENGLEYVQNAFGNFVVSEVLNQFSFQICKDIFLSMKGHFVRLSQNKFSSKFIEVCIDKAPIKIQDEIVLEFCDSQYLHKVVQSQFGNFVLQNSIGSYCKTEEQRNNLIQSVIISLQEVTDYKVQVKWGQEILMKYIQKIQDESEYHRLNDMIKQEMATINQKHQIFKQQQHIQMQRNVEVYSNNSQSKTHGRKNTGYQNQSNQYQPHQFQAMHYDQRNAEQQEMDQFQMINQPGWANQYKIAPPFDANQEGQYSKQFTANKYQKNNSQYGQQKTKFQKNKKGGAYNQQQLGVFQNKNYQKQNNNNDQNQQHYKQQYQKPLTLKRNNIQYANQTSNAGKQEADFTLNEQTSAQQNQDEMVNNPNLNSQANQSSRNSGITSNSIFTDDPTGLNQSSSGGTSEKANKQSNSQKTHQ